MISYRLGYHCTSESTAVCLAGSCMAVLQLASGAETILLKLFCKVQNEVKTSKLTLAKTILTKKMFNKN